MSSPEHTLHPAVITNPWLIWLFNHGWEDPGWGQTPVAQIMIATAIHELAGRLTDAGIKKQIQAATGSVVASVAGRMGE